MAADRPAAKEFSPFSLPAAGIPGGMPHNPWAAAVAAVGASSNGAASMQHHYMQQLQSLAGYAPGSAAAAAAAAAAVASAAHSSYGAHHAGLFGGASAGGPSLPTVPSTGVDKSLFGFGGGGGVHSMHFPPSDYTRPLPAHSPLPAHLRSNGGSPSASPMPAHMRSNPYQPTTNYHALNASPYPPAGAMHPSYIHSHHLQQQHPSQQQPQVSAQSQHHQQRPSGVYPQGDPYKPDYNAGYKPPALDKVPPDPRAVANGMPGVQRSPYGNYAASDYYRAAVAQQPDFSAAARAAVSTHSGLSSYLPSTPTTSSNGSGASMAASTPVGGYDEMAAQILNSFGGHFSSSLIQEDASKASSGLHHPQAPPPPSKPAQSGSRGSVGVDLSAPQTSSTSSSSSESNRQPRGPILDSRGQPVQSNGPVSAGYSSALPFSPAQLNLALLQPIPQAASASAHFTPASQAMPSMPLPPPPPAANHAQLQNRVASKSGEKLPTFKRRSSIDDQRDGERERKRFKANASSDDPYSFDDDGGPGAAASTAESSRFGRKVSTGPVYKFKNALLSREHRSGSTESRSSNSGGGAAAASRNVFVAFDCTEEAFLDNCDRLVDDLETKIIGVSVRPTFESYYERLAAKAEKKKAKKRKGEASSDHEQDEQPDLNSSASVEDIRSLADKSPKKSPGRKSKQQHHGSSTETDTANNNRTLSLSEDDADCTVHTRRDEDKKSKQQTGQTKKGGLWALPIVPKLPQKPPPPEQRMRNSGGSSGSAPAKGKDVDLCDVWRQAFGGVKPKKSGANESPSFSSSGKQKVKAEVEAEAAVRKKTYLDIPSEVRRRPRPVFGGLMHFAPDWEQRLHTYHKKCRLPPKLLSGSTKVKPRILTSGNSISPPSVESPLRPDRSAEPPSLSPQGVAKAGDVVLPDDLSPPKLSPPGLKVAPEAQVGSGGGNSNAVDKILESRRMRHAIGRMYKLPHMREKKKMKVAFEKLPDEGIGLLPTPGLPLLTQDTTDVLIGSNSNFGNFRRQTLLRYLDTLDSSGELKAKMLDWKPEVLETKTRRQSNLSKVVTNLKEIFGTDLPSATPSKKKKGSKSKKVKADPDSPKKEDIKLETTSDSVDDAPSPESKPLPVQSQQPPPSTSAFSEEDYTPSVNEEEMQTQLQQFALDLLDDNPSWSNKTVIQNLVIWEPIDPVFPEPRARKKPKKHKKRQSGLDFSNSAKKRGSKSREMSRAGSPDPESSSKDVRPVVYSLDQVEGECKGWVVDKGAGETILHRAAKMGYPDVAAYALDILKMPPSIKDNANIPPIHKAAFKGHSDIVEILLKYGVDPNMSVKGTRPLHEALESGSVTSVYKLLSFGSDPLLYDYSGNMPIDLAENDADMKRYLSALLADLHGKDSERWNVSHDEGFFVPPVDLEQEGENDGAEDDTDDDEELVFEVSAAPLPAYFQLAGREGHFVLAADLKSKPDKKAEVIDLSWDEFVQTSHCCLLGYAGTPVSDRVKLVKVDSALKRALSIESSPFKCFKNRT